MSRFAAVQDMSNTSAILKSLQEIGQFFSKMHQDCLLSERSHSQSKAVSTSELPVPDEVYKNAVDVLHPVANYLQTRVQASQKEKLSEMLAINSEIIDHLCEGILYPFVEETSLSGQREIKNSLALNTVLLLHVLLMECSENLKLKQKLIECGCIYLLFKELQNMKRFIQADTDSNKFHQQLIQTAASIVNNCLLDNIDQYMQLHPDTDISGSLNPYFKYPDSTVQLVCQLTYYHFSYYLHQSNPGSIDSPDTISNYTQLLSMASKSKHYVAKMDKLFIDATDLLKVLQCLSSCPKNRQFLIENSEFHKAITNLLLRDGKKEIECALDLLLTYLTEGQPIALTSTVKKRGRKEQLPLEDNREQARTQLLSYFPKLIDQLKSILASQLGVNCFKQLCSALLWCLQTNPDNDINSCFLYVQCCYEYKHYGECCYWSDYITQQCTANPEAKRLWDCFLLYKAKAKYHIYQRQHVVLRRSETLQSLGEMKQDRERVYEDTKDVISILGSLKVKKFPLDLKCEQFFDYALMDYIRELNKRSSKDSIYCMLCHKKQTVVRSHTVPEAVLKIIFKKNQEVVMMGPSSQSFDSRVKNPHTLTFNMLCSSCDNEVLSRDENLFLENIVKPIYQASSISHLEKFDKILYDKWLHRFCAGIIFRNLALSRGVVGSANANDIHKLFCYCRDIINPSTQENSSKQLLPKNIQIAMFFTPGMLDDQASDHEMSSNLIRALNSNVFCHLSNVPISGISSNLARKHYFFAVHFGIFNIVAFLEPLATKYHRFLVDPCKGEFSIPANSDRLSFIPPGLMKIFKEQSEKSVRQYLERLVEVSKEKKDISLTVLKSNVDGSPIGQPTSFSLLPQKYELNRQTNVITVKEGHLILLHTTHQLPSASHTVFLAVEEINPTKPYVIIHSHLDAPTMSQTFGYYITLPEFGFKAELDDNHKVLMHHIRSKNLDLFKLPAKMIPIMLQQAGLQNYQSILYHLYRNPGFDRKCLLGDGCWYCCHKCDICMLDATAGFSFQTRSEGAQDAKSTLRFHDEKCKAFSDCSHDYPSSFSLQEPVKEITFHLLPYYNSEELIGEVKCMHLLSAKLSYYDQRKHHPICASVDIYRVKKGNDRLLSGCLIALFDMRTYSSRTFGEFFLTDEFRLDKPLPHVNTIVDTEKIKVVNDIIHEVILKSGHDVKYFRSLGTQAANSIPPLVQENVDDCNEFIGLDFS